MAKDGALVVRMYTLLQYSTIELLYLLTYFFAEVEIVQPITTKILSKATYVVCRRFDRQRADELKGSLLKILIDSESVTGTMSIVDPGTVAGSKQFLDVIHAFNSAFLERGIMFTERKQ
jgi:hypothetical protein